MKKPIFCRLAWCFTNGQYLLFITIVICAFTTCSDPESDRLLTDISAEYSGITFQNTIVEDENLNVLNFHYIYNGGGIGIGDFNADGLMDAVFSGNMTDPVLYLNRGNLQFKEVARLGALTRRAWLTGVSIVDINADGWPDIYFSVGGLDCSQGDCKNLLLEHQGLDEKGVPQFKEMAAQYGLDDGAYNQQAAFFDFDHDGDLDAFLLRNVIDSRNKNVPTAKHLLNPSAQDQFLENQDGTFVNRTDELGINERGYGLGVVIDDFNQDNWPDIYVANDFLSDDALYLNLGSSSGGELHTGFRNATKDLLKHTAYNAMGVDAADINGDARPDIYSLDMLPATNERLKNMIGVMNYNKFQYTLLQGYSPQYVRNNLQLHNGFLEQQPLPFSEVGYMAGLHQTDWSWCPLLVDLDLDGDRDVYVTNGYGKDITNLDFINYSEQLSPFGTPEAQQAELYKALQQMQPVHLPNYVFEQVGPLHFEDRSQDWAMPPATISNGAAYADLDNDGDPDILINNLNASAQLLQNQSDKGNDAHYLQLQFKGTKANLQAIGAKVFAWSEDRCWYHFQSPVRGYLSTVDPRAHIGLGQATQVDSMLVISPIGDSLLFGPQPADQLLEIDFRHQRANTHADKIPVASTLFEKGRWFQYTHQENAYRDYDVQPLQLQQYSQQGPCLATARLADGNNLLYLGGSKGQAGQIVLVQSEQNVVFIQSLEGAAFEDTDAVFVDFDQDGDHDLYVVSGGNECRLGDTLLQDRVYYNDGKNDFSSYAYSPAKASSSCVRPIDIDQDGDLDLFVGGRLVPQDYPAIPKSYLLRNDAGQLIDATATVAPALTDIGMVTDAVWADVNQDEWPDLLLVGEWMPVTLCTSREGVFTNDTKRALPDTEGWWSSIVAADFDRDGTEEFVLGNLGWNTRLQASPEHPLWLNVTDLDKNGSRDPLIGQLGKNEAGQYAHYPLQSRDDAIGQVVSLKQRYVSYADFSTITFPEMITGHPQAEQLYKITQLSTSYLNMQPDGSFRLDTIPVQAQVAPVQAMLSGDFNQDGLADIVLSGNNYGSERTWGRQDAFNGLTLLGKGDGTFQALSAAESGFFVPGDGRDLAWLHLSQGHSWILAAQNQGALKLFRSHPPTDE